MTRPSPVPTVVGVACAYEAAALATGRLPTISQLQHRHPLIGVLVVGWLAVHFYRYQPPPPRGALCLTHARPVAHGLSPRQPAA